MKIKEKLSKYIFPSRFGSHKSMVTEDGGGDMVTCTDEYGPYQTERSRLDNRLSDPNRFNHARLKTLFEGKKKEKK